MSYIKNDDYDLYPQASSTLDEIDTFPEKLRNVPNSSDLISLNANYMDNDKLVTTKCNIEQNTSKLDLGNLKELSKHIKDLDLSLKNIFLEDESNMFMSTMLKHDCLLQDEKSFLKDKMLANSGTSFTTFSNSKNCVESLGEYFKLKSKSLNVDVSSVRDLQEQSSQISKLWVDENTTLNNDLEAIRLMLDQSLSPQKVVKVLCNKNIAHSNQQVENYPHTLKDDSHPQIVHLGDIKNVKLTELCDWNKENYGELDRSKTSVKTASTLNKYSIDRFPIKSNKSEIVWGDVKVGKSVVQNFLIQNKSQKKLRFQVSCSDPNFKLTKVDIDSIDSAIIVLYPLESRQIGVIFTPTSLGSKACKLYFCPIVKDMDSSKCGKQAICLYGYGGHCNLNISDIPRDLSGKMWINFGKLNEQQMYVRKFRIMNTGKLTGFAYFDISSKLLRSFNVDITVEPKKAIVKPKEFCDIDVIYRPSKLDRKSVNLHFLENKCTYEIGFIKCIYGSESTRGRLRKLYNGLDKKKFLVKEFIHDIVKPFCNEEIPKDIDSMSENIASMNDLINELTVQEIVLSIDHDVNMTTVMPESETTLYTLNHSSYDTMSDSDLEYQNIQIDPVRIVLTYPHKMSDTVLIKSFLDVSVPFHINIEPEGIVNVSIRQGILQPSEITFLSVFYMGSKLKKDRFISIYVCIKNNRYKFDVNIIDHM